MKRLFIYRKRYFLTGEPFCEDCQKETVVGVYLTNWNKKNTSHKYLCETCAIEANKQNMYAQEQRAVMVCDEPPPGALPVNTTPPGWSNSKNTDVFQAADKNIGGERVTDRTKLAGRKPESLQPPPTRPLLEQTHDPERILDFHKGGNE